MKDQDIVLLLLDRGVDVNFVVENTASLITAVKNGHCGYCVVSTRRNMQASGIYCMYAWPATYRYIPVLHADPNQRYK